MKSLGRVAFAGLMGVVLFGVGCVGSNLHRTYAQTGELKGARSFTLKDLKGEDVALRDLLKGHKAVLVNFWATWCPPCREEIPGLIATQEKYGGRSFTILGVDVGESSRKVSSFVQKIGINYPVVLDTEQDVAESYRVVGIPTSLLISSEGKILGEYHGYTPELVHDIEDAIK